MGILPDHELKLLGPSLIHPFREDMVQPASIDVHLDRYFHVSTTSPLDYMDPAEDNAKRFIDLNIQKGASLKVECGEFVLASTFERITMPLHLVARFEGKSSLGRLGLLTHITAGFIDPGFEGHITLEIHCVAPCGVVLHPGMKIGQICFEELTLPVDIPYGDPELGSHYQDQRGPTLSRSHENFSKIDVYHKPWSWGHGNWAHQTHGHDAFVKEAKDDGQNDIFIGNVCRNQQCKEGN